MNKAIKSAAILIILVAAFYLGFNYGQNKAIAPSINNNQAPEQELKSKAGLMLDFGNGDIKSFTEKEISKNQSAFDLVKQVAEENNIGLKYKDYGGELGIFIEAIGGVENNIEQWWQYWVNGNYSVVGAGSYLLQPGDLIEFKFVKGQITI